MRFEAARVLELADTLVRTAPGDRMDLVAERFASIDWAVERPAAVQTARRGMSGLLGFGSPANPEAVWEHLIAASPALDGRQARLIVVTRRPLPSTPGPLDNLSGLAVLPELARTWPGAARERLETRMAVTPDARHLAELLAKDGNGPATLVVTLDSPGAGPVVLSGVGEGAELTADAANALWVPVRRSWRIAADSGHAGFVRRGVPCVGLGGNRKGSTLDVAALGAVAQVLYETALRWGKVHMGSD